MATVFIPITVPDDELHKFLAYGGFSLPGAPTAQPVPTQPAAAPGFVRTESEFGYQVQHAPAQADPWAATGAPSPAAPYQPAPMPTAAVAQPTPQGGAPHCQHGEMRYVAAGFSKGTGKPYAAFYGCAAPRGQVQCKSIKAGQ